MGVFNQKSKFKPAAPTIRKEVVVLDATARKPPPRPSKPLPSPRPGSLRVPSSASRKSRTPSSGAQRPNRKSASPYPPSSSSDEKRLERKRKLSTHRPSPASDRVEFDKDDSDSDDGWEDALDTAKRRKSGQRCADLDRRLAAPLDDEDGHTRDVSRMIHAADVACLRLGCVPLLGADKSEVAVELQYPGSRQRER